MSTTLRETAANAIPTPRPRHTAASLAALGAVVAERGFDAHVQKVAAVAAAGRAVAPAASTVLQDPHAPTVARERALSVVSAALLRQQRRIE